MPPYWGRFLIVLSHENPWYPDHAMFSATKDQLKSMPGFKYSTE